MFAAALKRAWHRDLVSDPATHAWVIALYRAGERHPETVLDYFPSQHAPTPALAEKLDHHRADEARHTRYYTRALELLAVERNDTVEEPTGLDVFNNAIRACTTASFAIDDTTPAAERPLKVAHFLAHAHFLESRIATSLDYHLEACARAGRPAVTALVEMVHRDEERHTSYTRDAVFELLGARRARDVLAHHRRAEARADRLFSARQVRRFLRTFPEAGTHRALYAAAALLMDGGLPRG